MRSVKVAIATLGCRTNAADSIALEQAFIAHDAEIVPAASQADVYIINSCTVTHSADADAGKLARKIRRKAPNARIVVTGCFAQVARDRVRAIDAVDLVVGNDGKHNLARMVMRELPADPPDNGSTSNRRTRGRQWPGRIQPARSHITSLPESRTRPFLKVQDGCDYTCAFCIIPRARGVSRSLALDEVLDTALRYADLGACELVLTGIHLGHWGRDMTPRIPFAELVSALAERLRADGRIRRVRLGSVEPNEVTPELIRNLRDDALLCQHLHIPLQSGDDAVLRRMRRLYTAAEYADTIALARAALPDACIGADVLVGHPGEDDASFERTRAFIEALDLNYLHVFPFSARVGTPSADMSDPVPSSRRTARVRTLTALSRARRHFYFRRFVGRTLTAVSLRAPAGESRAVTGNYVPLRMAGATPSGRVVRARITRAESTFCRADVLA